MTRAPCDAARGAMIAMLQIQQTAFAICLLKAHSRGQVRSARVLAIADASERAPRQARTGKQGFY